MLKRTVKHLPILPSSRRTSNMVLVQQYAVEAHLPSLPGSKQRDGKILLFFLLLLLPFPQEL